MASLYTKMRKTTPPRYIFFFCLFLFPALLSARETTVPADAPFFADRSLDRRTAIVAAAPFEAECVSEPGITGRIAWAWILHRVEIEECRLPGLEGTYWFSPQVTVDHRGNMRIRERPAWPFLPAGVLALILFAAGVFFLRKTEPDSAKRCCLLAVMTVLLHCGLLALFLCRTGYPVPIFNDDGHYLSAARMISSGAWTENMFRYTVGYPLLCIPYVLFIRTEPISYTCLPAMSFVNGFVVSSLFAVCAFLLLRRISRRDLLSFGGVAAWQFFLFFLVQRPYDGTDGSWQTVSAFALPSPEIFTDVFPVLIGSGHNGMSDPASALVAMLCFLAVLYLKRPLLPLSILFGFLCLIRINNIFFTPVFLFLLILKYREALRKKGSFLFFCLAGALGFLAVFSVQFALNYIQFGNPFVFPYVLHPNRASQGFLLSEFPGGFLHTCQWNNACLAWALPSLLLMKDRLLRTVLVLAVMPMMLFFCGYPEWRIMDMRGMISLWPFLFAAPFLSDWWKEIPRNVLLTALGAAVVTTFLGAVPVRAADLLPWHLEQLPQGKTVAFVLLVIELAFLLFALIRARPYRDLFLFLAMFALLFHAGTALFAGILTAALCLLTLWDLIRFRRGRGTLEVPFLSRN